MIHAHAKSGCCRGEIQKDAHEVAELERLPVLARDSGMSRLSKQYGSESTTSQAAVAR